MEAHGALIDARLVTNTRIAQEITLMAALELIAKVTYVSVSNNRTCMQDVRCLPALLTRPLNRRQIVARLMCAYTSTSRCPCRVCLKKIADCFLAV
jgi:hypothetical protein